MQSQKIGASLIIDLIMIYCYMIFAMWSIATSLLFIAMVCYTKMKIMYNTNYYSKLLS